MSNIIDDLQYKLEELQEKIYTIERERGNIPRALSPFIKKQRAASRVFGKAWSPQALFGIHMAVCVDTRDPWKMGRILVYCPIIHNLRKTQVMSESTLHWAMPCSAFGSLDEVGSVFIPPEGSTVLILFEGGNRDSLFYIGCTWLPKRTDEISSSAGFTPLRERYRWSGSPGTRARDVRNQDPSHLLPPWNNESYFGNDYTVSSGPAGSESDVTIQADETGNIIAAPNAGAENRIPGGGNYSTQGWRSADIPHIYGIKTPEKHFLQFDDGSFEREQKLWGKRVVLQSSKGHFLIFKDDNDKTAEELYLNRFFDTYNDAVATPGGNPFNKPHLGHTVELNHTGVQLQSFGGGRLIIDDKIRGDLEPGQNAWSSRFPPSPQSGGSQKLWRTMIRLESHTEHRITLSDHHEDQEFQRSPKDGIFINTATGHALQMQDHTDQSGNAGIQRKILLQSTSGHKLEMKDYRCTKQSKSSRSTGRYLGKGQRGYRDDNVYDNPSFISDGKGLPQQVCFKLTSGFGQFLLFEDGSNQQQVAEQFVQLANAPGKNDPFNFLKMNQQIGRKLVHLRCAGERLTTVELNYLRVTERNEVLVAKRNQIHVVEEQNMIDAVLKKNLIQFIKLGNDIIFCRQGRHLTYAFKNTVHLCFTGPHIFLGGVPPSGGKPDFGASPVLLLGGEGPLPCRPSRYLISN
jgi:hypothetical protein